VPYNFGNKMKNKKEENKICNICHTGIDESKEFVRNTHFKNKDNIASEGFYHVQCFREKVLGIGELQKIQGQTMKMLNFVKDKLGMNIDEEVEVNF
jgi:hypothetical protein